MIPNPSTGSPAYQRLKLGLRQGVTLLNKAVPGAGDYFEKHLIFDDVEETVRYTGGDRLKLKPISSITSSLY